jgi:hypothetical protein
MREWGDLVGAVVMVVAMLGCIVGISWLEG